MRRSKAYMMYHTLTALLFALILLPLTSCSSAEQAKETVKEGISDVLRIDYKKEENETIPFGTEENSTEDLTLFTGNGYAELDTGVSFQGEFTDGEPADGAEGTLIISGLGSYTGNFENKQRNGYGQFFWEDGAFYSGSWKNDKMNGEGKLTTSDGTEYTGTFSDNNLNGTVTITFSNGDNYSGKVKNYKKAGEGVYTWADGAVYEGQWVDDQMNAGTYYFHGKSSNERLAGTFKDNKPNGTMRYYTKEGTSYSTTWQNGTCTKVEAK